MNKTGEIIIYKAAVAGKRNSIECRPFLNTIQCIEFNLQPEQGISLSEYSNQQLLILPIIGGVVIRSGHTNEFFIGAEQYYWAPDSENIWLTNPYIDNEICCLVFSCSNLRSAKNQSLTGIINLSRKNELVSILNHHFLKMSIGIYEGRQNGLYWNRHGSSSIICYVIRGVFEVSGRLLHPKDALGFNDSSLIEFEALSENAILIFIETT